MAWYVVYRGKVPGVYATWARCNAHVTGFKNKSFPNKEEAEASYLEFMGCEDDSFCQSSTKGAQKQIGVICCGCGAVFFCCWCSCGSFLLVATTACDAQSVPCKLVMTKTL